MNKSTLRFIVVLMAMLFLNIEAAQAGLISRFRLYIHREFPDQQFPWLLTGLVVAGFLLYILFAPVPIGKEKRVWLNYEPFQRKKHSYHKKRSSVSRIANVLNPASASNSIHS
jgi:hypothetical protein